MTQISRRSFLAGTTLLGAGLAVGLTGCGTPSAKSSGTSQGNSVKAAEQPSGYSYLKSVADDDVSETIDVDVVVCGSGTGGTFAAVRAAEQGASVLWLEKLTERGGSSAYTEGIAAINSRPMRDMNLDPKMGKLFCDFMECQDWGSVPEVVQSYINNNGSAIDWCLDHGAEARYSPVSPDTYWGCVCFDENGDFKLMGEGLLQHLWDFGDSLDNLEFRAETPAVNIIVEDDQVAGVYAQGSDGRFVRVNAKAVIVATGGFCNNDAMVQQYMNVKPGEVVFYGLSGRDGDGVNMCLAAGGRMHSTAAAMWTGGGIEGAPGFNDIANACFAWSSLLSVNEHGKRFTNEHKVTLGDTATRNLALKAQRASFAICDAPYVQEYIDMKELDYVTGVTVGDLEKEIETYDSIFKADTIAELAEMIGVPSDELEASVAEYNAVAEGAPDVRFGLQPESVIPVLEAPFYAAKTVPTSYATEGGARTDECMRVIGDDGAPIKGLYAIGNDNGSLIYREYPMHVIGGTAQGFAATGGFVAANDAMTLL